MTNEEIECQKKLYKELDLIKEAINNASIMVDFAYSKASPTNKRFSCTKCNKIIEKEFVHVSTWKSMDSYFNGLVGESLEIYHSECYNEKRR